MIHVTVSTKGENSMVRARRMSKNISSTVEPKKTDAPCAPEAKDWQKENAAFVAAYNELIDTEGVALEEYRLF